MLQTSDAFAALIDTAPENLHLTLPDGTEIPQTAIQSAYWVGGTNAGDDITLGSTVALQLQAELRRSELGDLDLTDTRLTATLTITGADDILPVAVLQVDKPNSDDDTVTIVACDAMIYAFSVEYALDDTALGFDWEAGVDGETLLQAICEVCGIPLATTGLTPVTLTDYTPSGLTYREVIAYLSCLWGRFARINGKGELVLGWYTAADRPVPPTRYYQGELKKSDYSYTIGYIKCYCETLEETMTAGDSSAAQGIYIECPWMTPARLREIFQEIGGMEYRPVSELRFLGDPRLEPGDVLQVTDRDGTTYTVPVMTLRQEYDGGLISQITAVGKSVNTTSDSYKSIWELFLFDDGSVFINSVYCPTVNTTMLYPSGSNNWYYRVRVGLFDPLTNTIRVTGLWGILGRYNSDDFYNTVNVVPVKNCPMIFFGYRYYGGQRIGMFRKNNYLGTINNLSRTIEKTSDKTMKITYTIQEM